MNLIGFILWVTALVIALSGVMGALVTLLMWVLVLLGLALIMRHALRDYDDSDEPF